MSNTVKWEGYVTIACPNVRKNPRHPGMWKSSARVSVNKPAVSSDEIAVKVAIELPSTLFQRPSLEARITVPDRAVQPPNISLEVIDDIERMIHQNTGFDVKLVQVDGKEGA